MCAHPSFLHPTEWTAVERSQCFNARQTRSVYEASWKCGRFYWNYFAFTCTPQLWVGVCLMSPVSVWTSQAWISTELSPYHSRLHACVPTCMQCQLCVFDVQFIVSEEAIFTPRFGAHFAPLIVRTRGQIVRSFVCQEIDCIFFSALNPKMPLKI